jgi:hypothetical protein
MSKIPFFGQNFGVPPKNPTFAVKNTEKSVKIANIFHSIFSDSLIFQPFRPFKINFLFKN